MMNAIGIDLGTKKSLVGVMKDRRPFVIPNKYGEASIPSLVLVTPEEKIFAGPSAQRHADRFDSKNITIGSIKRLIGRNGETGWGWWKTYPQEVSAFILGELKKQAEEYLGGPVEFAVIAIPSHFDESQRRATKEAAEIAGIKNVVLLNESIAAALAYGFNKRDKGNEKILVFDFGAGTLDVSILDLDHNYGTYDVLCVEGDGELGGDDFDSLLADYIIGKIRGEFGDKTQLTESQRLLIKEASESAKIQLSTTLSTQVYIPGFLKIGDIYHNLNVQIDRSVFEKLAKPLIERATAAINRALNESSLKTSDLNAFLLLGGCRHIPLLCESIRGKYKITPITGVDPETCVVQGACIQAGIRTGGLKEILLLDVIPSSYGIQLESKNSGGGNYFKIIEKNTTVPVKKTHTFTTSYENQSEINVRVYQGESEDIEKNLLVGFLELKDIQPAPAGVPKIEVSFDIDVSMTVAASAKDLRTGKSHKILLRSPYGLNSAQVRIMGQKLSLWLSEQKISGRN